MGMSGKVGPGKSASVVTENPERVTVGKSRRGRETNSESLLFGKERIWCPERRNHLSEAYGQQTKSRDSNPRTRKISRKEKKKKTRRKQISDVPGRQFEIVVMQTLTTLERPRGTGGTSAELELEQRTRQT